MPTSSNVVRAIFPSARRLAVAASLILSVGCSDDGFGTRYPVSGTVTYKGEHLKKGTITFAPNNSADGRPASGMIDDGAYSLTTFTPNDGVLPGSYKVSIVSAEVDASAAQAAAQAAGSAVDEALMAKAAKKAKSLIPKKYSKAETSGFTKDVKAEPNTFDFELVD